MKTKGKVKPLIIIWTVGLLGGIIFWLLRITKRVEIKGVNNLKRLQKADLSGGLLVISNHLSLWEPVLMTFLFFPKYLFDLRFIPFSTPAKKDFYNKWWFWFFRPVCIPIEREKPREELKALKKMEKILREGGILILFPEGGRTFMGKKFRYSLSGSKKIRQFPRGIKRLFLNGGQLNLPVWAEGGDRVIPNKDPLSKSRYFPIPRFWRKTTIYIGEPFGTENIPQDEVIKTIEDAILDLGERSKALV